MNFERAMDECRKAGGGRIQDSQCNTWRVNIEGDPIKICGCDCVAGYDWKCLPEQPQPAPQPELMTGIEAIVKTVNQGGGEIYYAATLDGDKGEPEFRVSVSSDSKIIDGTICALNGWGKIYTVRPLPPEIFDLTEAMARLMRGESVEYTHHGRSYCIVPRITAYCESAGSSITVEFSELKGMTFRAVVK